MSLYAASAEFINTFLQYQVIPVGEPLIKVIYITKSKTKMSNVG